MIKKAFKEVTLGLSLKRFRAKNRLNIFQLSKIFMDGTKYFERQSLGCDKGFMMSD